MNQEIESQEGMTPTPYPNVLESWPIYDTLIVSAEFFGQEANVDGWFTTFAAMGQEERHSFYKSRTESNCGLWYSNKQTQDSIDYAYDAYSIGCAFIAPSVRSLWEHVPNVYTTTPAQFHSQIAHWWEVEFPRHCSIRLKVQQDIVAELPCMACPPGYGPSGGGASFEHEIPFRDTTEGSENQDYHPLMIQNVSQGEPDLRNRFNLVTHNEETGEITPLQIARTNTLEAEITVAQPARDILSGMTSVQPAYLFGGVDGEDPTSGYTSFPARFMIQVSLIGKRGIQSRGRYHR